MSYTKAELQVLSSLLVLQIESADLQSLSLQGTAVTDIDQLQTAWCRYADQQVQRGATWMAIKSPSVQRRLVQQPPLASQQNQVGDLPTLT